MRVCRLLVVRIFVDHLPQHINFRLRSANGLVAVVLSNCPAQGSCVASTRLPLIDNNHEVSEDQLRSDWSSLTSILDIIDMYSLLYP